MELPLETSDSLEYASEYLADFTIHETTASSPNTTATSASAEQLLTAAMMSGDISELKIAINVARSFNVPAIAQAEKLVLKIEKDARKAKNPKLQQKIAKSNGKGTPGKYFYEKQHGSYCRMHALNAFYQHERLTPEIFNKLCMQFDSICGFSDSVSAQFFYVGDGGKNLISWIVEKDLRYETSYFPPGKYILFTGEMARELMIPSFRCFFRT